MAGKKIPLATRFWNKVDKNGPIVRPELGPCWVWTGKSTFNYGYGRIDSKRAHRTSWEMHNGPIPNNLCVLHRCDNPPCVRPNHLFLGTMKDNMQDMTQKGRATKGTHRTLNEAKVREIRQRHAEGIGRTALASEYGVSKFTITQCVNRTRWSHVD